MAVRRGAAAPRPVRSEPSGAGRGAGRVVRAEPPASAPGDRRVHRHRSRLRREGVGLAGLTVLLVLVCAIGTLSRAEPAVAGAAVVMPLAAVGLLRLLRPAFPRHQDMVVGQLLLCVLTLDALVLAALLQTGQLSTLGRGTVVLCMALAQALRCALWLLVSVDGRQVARRVEVRNLPGAPPPLPGRPWVLTTGGLPMALLASAVAPAAWSLALAGGSYGHIPLAAAVAVLALLAVVLRCAASVLSWSRSSRGRVRAVHEAALEHDPLVLLYSAGGPDDLYWVDQWLDTLEHLPRRSIVVLRDPEAMDRLRPTSAVVVCLPDRYDVGAFLLPRARVCLFVAHGTENVRMLRRPTLRSAYVGHGDSDKGVSASPLHKAYDERWVAGEVGRQRLLAADVGLRADGIRLVGRPQVRRISRAAPPRVGGRYAVLYAPSWEGVDELPDESSLLHSGLDIVRDLLARDDVRVVYRPHPKTGERNKAFVRRHHEIVALLEQAGAPHRLDEPLTSDLTDCMNSVDALVADRSGVLSDFLASEKPCFVVNASGLSDEDFRASYPSVRGAYLLGRGGTGLSAALDDARGPDTRRGQRQATRIALLGPPVDDGLGPFVEAVDALAGTLRSPADPVTSHQATSRG